jgi:hypothetical protein
MKYDPPINKRTTEQLMEIIETREQWENDIVEIARIELVERGISVKKQETRRKNKNNYLKKIGFIKSNATYSTREKILIVLFGPILAILLDDFLMFHSGEGFRKKNRQGTFYLALGIGLWGLMFYVCFANFE